MNRIALVLAVLALSVTLYLLLSDAHDGIGRDGAVVSRETTEQVEGVNAPLRSARPGLHSNNEIDRAKKVFDWESLRAKPNEIVIFGRVIDVYGKGSGGGRLTTTVAGKLLGVADVIWGPQEGTFRIRAQMEREGDVQFVLRWRSETLVSKPTWIQARVGEVKGPVEIVGFAAPRITVRIVRPQGVEVQRGNVVLKRFARPVSSPQTIDVPGEVSWLVSPEPHLVEFVSIDGSYRGAASIHPKVGAHVRATIQLVGPWREVGVYLESSEGSDLGGEIGTLTLRVGAIHIRTQATIDGDGVPVWVPPGSNERASLHVSGDSFLRHTHSGSWNRLEPSESDWVIGLRAAKTCRGRMLANGREPIRTSQFRFRGKHFDKRLNTDTEGRFRARLPEGRYEVYVGSELIHQKEIQVATVDVDESSDLGDIRVKRLNSLGGRLVGSGLLIPMVRILTVRTKRQPEYVVAAVSADPETGEWTAWVPQPVGTTMILKHWHMNNINGRDLDVVVGGSDHTIRIEAASLHARVSVGNVLRPQGYLRYFMGKGKGHASQQVTPQRWPPVIAPIVPGTYRFQWSPDGKKPWTDALDDVVVVNGENDAEIRFPAPSK